ncbi:hypothetical protein R9X49_22265 [Pectobacterium carotovorum]|uniref:hypothetical protein n=1 Tax=Pectobacterium carotovorum TaxID=554 RepID=UPI0029D8FBAE|nr:hypothetical protein [Pectobacterium carotovorum]MDX6917825.1 hypothetical protein [Pectobacterium carotovorum]
MLKLPERLYTICPIEIEACLDDETDNKPDLLLIKPPDNVAFCSFVEPISEEFLLCGIKRDAYGNDSEIYLLPINCLSEHLMKLRSSATDNELVELLLKRCRRWLRMGLEYLRLAFPVKQETFNVGQQIWGHDIAAPSPVLTQRAHQLSGGKCATCEYYSRHNTLMFRDGNLDNHDDANLAVVCPVCACSRRLNNLGANDGVMVYLPELKPADLSRLLRTVIAARQHGDARQKKGATAVLHWLIEHRKEAEAFWGTSHPGEFGQALIQVPEEKREDLQQRLRHIALIPNPDILSDHIEQPAVKPTAWQFLLDEYRSHP